MTSSRSNPGRWVAACVVALVTVLTTVRAAGAAPLILAEDGSARASILTPAEPSPIETYAAGQLARYLGKMSGTTLEVVAEKAGASAPARPVIAIVRTSLARGLKMQGPQPKRTSLEAFRMVRRGDALIICGNQAGVACDNGTLWGAYALLEMQGVGRYLSDELGLVVPRKAVIAVDELDVTDAPALEMRGGDDTAAGYLARRMKDGVAPELMGFGRQASARRMEFFHAFQYIATNQVRQEHPEWFENTRNSPHGPQPGPSPHIGYGLADNGICLVRPEIRKLFIDFFRERFRANPTLWAASIAPDDYVLGDRCPCPGCQRLLDIGGAPSFPDARGAPRSASDLLVSFVNAVAEGLAEEFPDRKLITLAYLDYLDPPKRTRVHRNVIIMPAPLSTRNELSPALDDMVAGWRRMGAQKVYWYGYILTRPPIPHLMGEWYRNHRRRGVDGVYLEFSPVPVMNAISGWLYGKLGWNPQADVGGLIDEYCLGLFGPEAGPILRRFFLAAWEVNPPLYDEIPALFAAAERMAGDPASAIARRVRFFKLSWELYHSSLALDAALKAADVPGAHRIVKAGIGAAENLKAEFPWAIRSDVWLHNTAHMEYSVTVLPALERLRSAPVTQPNPEAPAPGPARCLTNNADVAESDRVNGGVTVSFDQPAGGLDGAKLFDGLTDGPANNLSPGAFPVWHITLDMGKPVQIDRVEICTGRTRARWDIVPIYIEVQLSDDGKDFQIVQRIQPRTLRGFVASRSLYRSARYVRLRLGSLNMWHAVSEVRVWGR
ncbi:MAG: hypothetical protein CMJ18_26850 [Phycisphaeraceae bacterium]|nr:hypothetical protein [Phycisphaeraceae bacterium]